MNSSTTPCPLPPFRTLHTSVLEDESPSSPSCAPSAPVKFPGGKIQCMPLPGVRCPTCLQNGLEIWVIPGRACGNCGTNVILY